MEKETGKHVAGGRAPRQKKTKKPSRLTRQQKILIAVAAVLAVVLVAVVACQSLFVRPELNLEEDKEEIDYGEGVRPKSGGERKSEDYYTVLILGRDTGGGGNTDTILLASYDVTNQKATIMSIPRDTMVNIPYDIKRINAVYNYGGGGDDGIKALYKEISQLVGFEPDYQVVVEWEAVGEIVDAIGGVWFDVPRDMNYDDPAQNLHIHQTAGYRLLSGDDAMQVLRYRHDNRVNGVMKGYADGDLGRIKTQQAFLKAVVEQMLQVKNITKINQFAKVFEKNVETDLSFSNLCWFGQQAVMGGLSVENVEFVTMPNTNVSCWSRIYQNYQSYVVPNADELLELVNTKLSPFVEPCTLSDLDIMSVNSNGSVSSTTGYVEDSKAASAPVKPSKPVTQAPSEDTPQVDENGNVLDPETGLPIETEPETGTAEPNTGTTEPGTGSETGGSGTTEPSTGGETGGSGTTTEPGTGGGTGTTEPGTSGETGTGTTESGTGGTAEPSTGETGASGGESGAGTGETGTAAGESGAAAADPGFVVIDPAA